MMPGDYVLESITVWDHEGNCQELDGTGFDGTTDFSKLMPQGHVITLTP